MNRLANETSPYLLQHASNPVDWYPWGEEALSRARDEQKPIFLSIGYSACHWCHVMERESFESEAMAAKLNESFIPVKVDREERPDLDDIYMAAVQMMTGAGGWPLSVWLTPDLKPFFGGTYFPPADHWSRPGFGSLLDRIATAWREQRDAIEADAGRMADAVRQLHAPAAEPAPSLTSELVEAAVNDLRSRYDRRWGGFGVAPKFPPSMALELLLRRQEAGVMDMVTATLNAMMWGGMYDQVGGGFHRYSVDERWLVPHFEKMLYDNALLGRVYAEAWKVTGNEAYKRVVTETFGWVFREMTDAAGGFYSSLDADSEGEEGIYYTWTPDELDSVLGREEASLVGDFHGVTPRGNFEGRSIPHVPVDPPSYAKGRQLDLEELEHRIVAAHSVLLEARTKRVPPGLDDKMTEWNGLMIGALARAGDLLEQPDWIDAAERAARFVLERLRPDGKLLRTFRKGDARVRAFQTDYVQLAAGLLELHRAGRGDGWLGTARELMEEMDGLFRDPVGGYFTTSAEHETLIARMRDSYDGVIPSGNAQAAMAWLLLDDAAAGGDEGCRERARATLGSLAPIMARSPGGAQHALRALDLLLEREAAPAAAPWRAASQSLAASGRPVVEVTGRVLSEPVAAGTAATLVIELAIADGWHLNGPTPDREELVATELVLEGPAVAEVLALVYPPAERVKPGFSEEPMDVYRGRVAIEARFATPATLGGEESSIQARLRLQSCDDARCLLPETLTLELPLRVAS